MAMANGNENGAYNNGLHNNRNDIDENNEYHSNVVRAEPDIGLGNCPRQQDRQHRSENSIRQEDNTVSFRHVLQNDPEFNSSGVCPDLYSYSRLDRLNVDVLDVDPESPDLPDFVQDHLAVEHMYFNDGTQASKIRQNLPDFASCVQQNCNNERRIEQSPGVYLHGQENRRTGVKNQIPLDLPVPNFPLNNEPQAHAGTSLPFDLTTQVNVAIISGESRSPVETEITGMGGRLPDFLSDGHVLGHSNPRNRDTRIITSENDNGLDSYTERHNFIIMLREENNRLRDEFSMLQSVLMKKDDRIKELEDLVMALEISKLQMSSDVNTQTVEKTATEDEVIILKRELETVKKEILKLQKEKSNSFAELRQRNLPDGDPKEKNTNLAIKVKEMTSASEQLVRELLKIITEMQTDINVNDCQNVSISGNTNNNLEDSSCEATSSI